MSENLDELKQDTAEVFEQAAEKNTQTQPVSVKQQADTEPHWYVIHTYSGYENKVKTDIEKTIENRKLQDQMLEVIIPTQDVVEIKDGVKKTVSRKLFPGYVLIHMINNDITWYVVRNTRGVTGFVGPGSQPVPLSEVEVRRLGVKVDVEIGIQVGDTIRGIAGAWKGYVGCVKAVNTGRETATIDVDVFGRPTSVELSFSEIEKM